MAPGATNATSLISITVVCAGESIDFSIPPRLPLAEVLPGIVDSFGRLDPRTASAGYSVRTSAGRRLDQSAALEDQGIRSGALLTLVPIGEAASDRRYDDLVEAVGDSVEDDTAAWTREDSILLSSHASAALILAAAALLILSAPHSHATMGIAATGALLVAATAALIARSPSPTGALGLAHTVPILTAVAVFALVDPGWTPQARLALGFGLAFGACAILVLPAQLRPSIAAPLLTGGALALDGSLGAFADITPERCAALVLALLLLLVLSAPWLALAHMPVQLTGPRARERVDSNHVRQRIRLSAVFVLAFKTGASAAALILAPALAHSTSGILLLVCTGTALMLSTRTLRSRAEVLIGVFTGMLLTLGSCFAAALHAPHLAPWIGIAVGLVAILLLIINVVEAKMRPWLTRTADALGVLVLLAIAPLTALVWGVL